MTFEQLRIRILFIILAAATCYGIAFNLGKDPWIYTLIGGWIATVVVIAEKGLSQVPINKLVSGVIGLAVGLLIANLIGYPLLLITQLKEFSPWILLAVNVVCASVGLTVGLKREEDVFGFISHLTGKKVLSSQGGYKILDTSVIIDGRIAEICETDFIEGVLIIPQFVLAEVQQIADSPSPTKRTRGKRGLDIINRLQSQEFVPVEIVDTDFPDLSEVDSKLIRLAKAMGAKIITNDYNLKKVAKIQNIKVLNINELATALKPILLPGESLKINIIKEGENPNQGIAYLEDGTMVVVEGGKKYIGKETEVVVTSVLQTTTGKMIFTEIKEEGEKEKKKFRSKSK
ncbi:PIN domain-containing protein [Candidatus Aerophobetes bacterium]|nr:PIN domain-containing protein [Candidatus Aerophobetes bacterium]